MAVTNTFYNSIFIFIVWHFLLVPFLRDFISALTSHARSPSAPGWAEWDNLCIQMRPETAECISFHWLSLSLSRKSKSALMNGVRRPTQLFRVLLEWNWHTTGSMLHLKSFKGNKSVCCSASAPIWRAQKWLRLQAQALQKHIYIFRTSIELKIYRPTFKHLQCKFFKRRNPCSGHWNGNHK